MVPLWHCKGVAASKWRFHRCLDAVKILSLVDDDFVADHLLIYFHLIVSMTSGFILYFVMFHNRWFF